MPQFEQDYDFKQEFVAEREVIQIDMDEERLSVLAGVFGKMCQPNSCMPNISVGVREIDGKSFVTFGPMKPLAGYALSNLFNREFFGLDPSWSDLFLAQTRQSQVTHENSFVVHERGELVFVRADTSQDAERVLRFLTEQEESVRFVLENPDIDPFLRHRNFEDAKTSFLASQENVRAL